MKKLILLLIIITTSTTTFSQVKLSPGVKLGLNMANISNLEESSSKLGLTGGLFLNVHLSNFYELQLETMYSSQGAKANYYYFDSATNSILVEKEKNANLNYVSVGFANRFFIIKDLGLHLIIGPSIDIKVSDNFGDDELAPLDLSFFGGVGYKLPIGLEFDLRYKQGILDIDDGFTAIGSNSSDDPNNLNGVIQLTAAYRFNF